MTTTAILRYQFGDAESIRQIAVSRASFWIGAALALITAIPRNYDQFHISEQTWKWILGPLGFSLISGSWIYLVAYRDASVWGIKQAGLKRTGPLNDWMSFMGLFWMTAPIAWIYALPVERAFDSIAAAKANLTLLGVVSVWRVWLMTRAIRVACNMDARKVFCCVYCAVSAEVFMVAFFGGAFAKSLMAGMGGMRNSPEETILLDGIGAAMFVSFWTFPIAFVAMLAWGRKGPATPLPERIAGKFPAAPISIAAAAWVAVAIAPQLQAARNARLDALVENGEFAKAVAFMSEHQPGDFAPARQLPPRAYERTVYQQLPAMLQATDSATAPWIQDHLTAQLDVMLSHARRWHAGSPRETVESLDGAALRHLAGYGDMIADDWLRLLQGLQQIDSGRAWLAENQRFLALLLANAEESKNASQNRHRRTPKVMWEEVSVLLREDLGVTTNAPPAVEIR